MQPAAHHAPSAVAPRATPRSGLRFDTGEEELIQVNLADLELPRVNNLDVDGLKPSWFARLFGRR